MDQIEEASSLEFESIVKASAILAFSIVFGYALCTTYENYMNPKPKEDVIDLGKKSKKK